MSTRSSPPPPAGLLRDLLDLYQIASLVDITWGLVGQAARAARDTKLIDTVIDCSADTAAQHAWLTMTLRALARRHSSSPPDRRIPAGPGPRPTRG